MIGQERSATIDILPWDEVITIVNIFGNLDYKNANSLRSQINLVVKTSPRVLVINMQNVEFIDSSGLGVLITILKAMRANGGKLLLSGMQEYIVNFFEITQTNNLFETCNSFFL